MSAATTEAPAAEHRCSCGRSFAHEISLKRHCWVTGHTAEEAPAAAAAPVVEEVTTPVLPVIELPTVTSHDVVDEAVRILREKQQAQIAFETRQARERQVRAALEAASAVVQHSVQKAAETSRQGMDVVRTSTLLALRMMVMLLICGGLLLAGMGVGRLMATPADAQAAPSGQRQLAGFQTQVR